MIVIVLSKCPPSLRGDLTLWLQEIATGVYVGHVSARVRDQLWERITKNIKTGQATLVYSANNEQGHSIRVHGTNWEVVDHEGLEIIIKPSREHVNSKAHDEHTHQSYASQMRSARKATRSRRRKREYPSYYVVLDLETTGLNSRTDQIIEIACIVVMNHEVKKKYTALIGSSIPVPSSTANMTGIDNKLLQQQGRPLNEVLLEVLDLLDDYPIVAHNAQFDLAFLQSACEQYGFAYPPGNSIDTLSFARRKIPGLLDYKLNTLIKHLKIPVEGSHRALIDCEATMYLYEILIKMD